MSDNPGSKPVSAEDLNPETIGSALELMISGYVPIAGGTDLLIRRHSIQAAESHIPGMYGNKAVKPFFFTGKIDGFRDIAHKNGLLRIGAGAVLTDIINYSSCPGILKDALLTIAAPGIRNIATLCGNVCNASPAADSLPVLYVLNAGIEIASLKDEPENSLEERILYKEVSINDFITGPGATVLKDNEIVTAINLELPFGPENNGYCGYFRKVGTRAANALAKLNAAAVWKIKDGVYSDFRLAVGACGPKIIRCPEAENIISGSSAGDVAKLLNRICSVYEDALSPIDDQRSTSEYRKNTALRLIRQIISDSGGSRC